MQSPLLLALPPASEPKKTRIWFKKQYVMIGKAILFSDRTYIY
ncbi:hypothetical protein QUB80_31030 [Chlorogloeopsis sp. ULAP01]|nr:hypothetical protein [Chlorogloeopsis sp. ULAP01]